MDAIDQLFRRLVLAAQAADALARPLDVGELLETFIPYRAARRDGLIDTNDDYLHLIMQLVAGERDLLFADDLMQDDLRSELASPNPDLAILRTYVNSKVRLSSTAVQRVLEGDTAIDLRPPTPVANVAVTPPSAGAAATTAEPPSAARVESHSPDAVADDSGCPYCSQPVPTDRPVRYCPSCGINLRVRRCPGCSTEIESEWKFCVTCGRSAA